MAIWDGIRDALRGFDLGSVIEVLGIATLIYLALLLLKGTTAMSLLRGIVIIFIVAFAVVNLLQLTVLSWLLTHSLPAVLLAIPIIFQSEIRRFLERLGRTGRWPWPGRALYEGAVDITADSSLKLAEQRHGAIIVISRDAGLEEY